MTAKLSAEILDRLPPQSLEAEKAVLGSILLVPDVCDEIALILQPDDFYADAHQKLYAHIQGMHDQGQRIDAMLLLERLKAANQLEAVGGLGYLAEVAQSVASASNVEYYARLVRDKATLRSLILAATEVLRSAYDPTQKAQDLVSRAEETIFAVNDRRAMGEVAKMDQVVQEAFLRIDARLKGEHSGIETGFADLDALTGGLHPGELIILAARPSMGKTALATNVAEHVAVDLGVPTLFVSLEMSRLELAQRMLCSRGEINGNKFRNAFLSSDDKRALVEASAVLSQAPLYIDDTPTRSVTEIAATARRLKRKQKLGLLILDYLQLIDPDNDYDPRQEQVAKMARRLKAVARELKIPVLCLAQLNRAAEMSKDNRPRLSHLRESGAIEQDADVVMFVHREEYYLTRAQREDPAKAHLKGLAEIIVAKQRNGPTGSIDLCWIQDFTRFKNRPKFQHDEFEQYTDEYA
jgi:replicative DNA helicase